MPAPAPSQEFAKFGIKYESSEKSKSDIYLEFVPLMLSGRVDLLEVKQLQHELRSLERRTRSGGKDSETIRPGVRMTWPTRSRASASWRGAGRAGLNPGFDGFSLARLENIGDQK